ncbi:hypothetical protein QYF36_011603 [Acer negundo]|nr:hypothetical protein QYF36_011603 [Acer negundo]
MEALLNTGWWNNNTSSDHCEWYGISCNSAGFISEIHVTEAKQLIAELTQEDGKIDLVARKKKPRNIEEHKKS